MDRLWERIDRVGDCWVFTGMKTNKGYGKIRVGSRTDGTRKMVSSHRLSWELTNGKIPDGMHVLHRCDNPSCINPAHLFLGSNQDNMSDMANKGRSRKSIGVLNPSVKLTEEQVREIKLRLKNGESVVSMEDDYPVGRELLYHIKNNRNWSHIKLEKRKG